MESEVEDVDRRDEPAMPKVDELLVDMGVGDVRSQSQRR